MPLPIAHGLLGASVVAAIHPEPTKRYFLPLLIGGFLANAADFDFALVILLKDPTWHRDFTHSVLFAFFVCLIFIFSLGKRYRREAVAFGLAYSSHAFLDYATTKAGNGVELFWFFSPERLKLGLFSLSEMPSRLSLFEIVKTLALELLIFAPVLLLIIFLRTYIRKISGAEKGLKDGFYTAEGTD
jgi:membrane-bound metal-dependent hydrolase YbcI (DUF457 family)